MNATTEKLNHTEVMHSTQAHLSDWSLLITRVALGTVIAAHGAQKLFGWFGGFGFDGSMDFFMHQIGLSYLLSLLVILTESVGMLAFALGLFTRFWAIALTIIMVGAISTSSAQYGFFMNWFGNQAGEGFEFHLVIIVMALPLALQGAGAWSLDHQLVRQYREHWLVKKLSI